MNSETHKATALADKTCPHCHQEFQNINPKVFSNHVRWCQENPDRIRLSGEQYRNKQKELINERIDRRLGKLTPHKVICAKCGKEFEVLEREKQFPLKEKYYCSRTCSNSHIFTEETRRKTSASIKRWCMEHGYRVGTKPNGQPYFRKLIENVTRHCEHCGKEFVVKSNSKKRFCNNSCASQHKQLLLYNGKLAQCRDEVERERLMLHRYRQQCEFKFALNAYPDEFDFDLIRKYGWYKAKNHGDNQNGVNRDHMYSVKDGFVNHVDPKIISHPANCQLLLHSANVSKKDKSSITLEELLNRIDRWNKKYKDFQTQEETQHGRGIQTRRS